MSLAESRLRAFFSQFSREHGYGWQTEIFRKTKIHQTHVGRILSGDRGASPATIEAVQRAYNLAPAYFSDPEIGDAPDFHLFENRETVTELDSAKGTAEVEAYLAEVPATPEHAAKLRGMRRHGWTFEREEIVGLHAGLKAADARREIEGLAVPAEPRKKLPPPKRR